MIRSYITISIFLLFSILSCDVGSEKAQETDKPVTRISLGEIESTKIEEASGIAASKINPGILWTHNDSGGESIIYAISTDAKIIESITLPDAPVEDWEDICIGPGPLDNTDYIYIAETGDNAELREIKHIIRFKEPKLLNTADEFELTVENYELITFRFPDKIHDCEAIMIDPLSKDIYLVSKRSPLANVYKLTYPQSTVDTITADFVETLPIGEKRTNSIASRVCGSDISRRGDGILIKTYDSVFYFGKSHSVSLEDAFKGKPVALEYSPEPQGEAICFTPDGGGYYTLSERSNFDIIQQLYYYSLKDANLKNQ